MTSSIGVLTGGGDCPGLNAVIRAVVRRGMDAHNLSCYGFRAGWHGVLSVSAEVLNYQSTRGILHRGGTILGTSRVNPIQIDNGPERIREALDVYGLDGLIVIGGEGTLSASTQLNAEHGVPIIGVPKTIDNDLGGTELTVGFSTALDIATEAVDRLHSTAESHNRVMLLEVMGRHAGWIATYSGLAGGADAILIPEHPFDIRQVCRRLKRRHGMGRPFSIVVVAEGAVPAEGTIELPEHDLDEFGRPRLGGIANFLAPIIEERTGFPCRVSILSHIQRGGNPNAMDRVIGTNLGVAAVDMAAGGEWGKMVGWHGNAVASVPLREATAKLKGVPKEMYQVAEVFFG